ncbi:unnamed protein product [Periconia digitata]|uniref:Uncharacterized protein n=1 Tax=Periconia digitata TaxID=1303443 RepID=A0A9W4UJJ9_9PLEO|nr:unnamed protein product [Periconia digitata]
MEITKLQEDIAVEEAWKDPAKRKQIQDEQYLASRVSHTGQVGRDKYSWMITGRKQLASSIPYFQTDPEKYHHQTNKEMYKCQHQSDVNMGKCNRSTCKHPCCVRGVTRDRCLAWISEKEENLKRADPSYQSTNGVLKGLSAATLNTLPKATIDLLGKAPPKKEQKTTGKKTGKKAAKSPPPATEKAPRKKSQKKSRPNVEATSSTTPIPFSLPTPPESTKSDDGTQPDDYESDSEEEKPHQFSFAKFEIVEPDSAGGYRPYKPVSKYKRTCDDTIDPKAKRQRKEPISLMRYCEEELASEAEELRADTREDSAVVLEETIDADAMFAQLEADNREQDLEEEEEEEENSDGEGWDEDAIAAMFADGGGE